MSTLAIHGGDPVRTRPFPEQRTLGDAERRAVLEVLDDGVLSDMIAERLEGGPRVRAAEEDYAARMGTRHGVATNSATTGLQAAVAAVGVQAGDEVICSPYTMSASAAVVLSQNGIPVFADIEDRTYGLDPASVTGRITEHSKAILVVHLFGHPAEMGPILDLAERHGLAVIEDAAQSIGATWEGRQTGTLGDVGVLSLNYHKIIHSGEGGMLLTDDDEIALRAKLVRNHGELTAGERGVSIPGTLGSNFRMTELEASIARAQLDRLEELLAHRRALAARLTARLAELSGVVPPQVREGCTSSFYVYGVRVLADQLDGVSRDLVADALEAEGIPLGRGYVAPIYRQPLYQQRAAYGRGCPWTCGPYRGEVSYEPGICPTAERLYEDELLILDVTRAPLTDRDVDDVADAFEKVLENRAALRAGRGA